jgi:hypothetical protein
MRIPLLSERFSQTERLFDSAKTEQVGRRQFIQGILIVGASLTALGSATEYASAQQFDDAEAWRDRVTGFVSTIFDPSRAQSINSQIQVANIDRAPSPTDLHTAYAAPWVFTDRAIDTKRVVCDNGFALVKFPLYDVQCPCRDWRDLNAAEIACITSSTEWSRFKCVVAPDSPRMPVEYADHADFRKAVQDVYNRKPEHFRVHYKRHFTTHSGRRRRAYLASDISQTSRQPEVTVFIGAEDI